MSGQVSYSDIKQRFPMLREIACKYYEYGIPEGLLDKYGPLFYTATHRWAAMDQGRFIKLYGELLPQLYAVRKLFDEKEREKHQCNSNMVRDYDKLWNCAGGRARVFFQKPAIKE